MVTAADPRLSAALTADLLDQGGAIAALSRTLAGASALAVAIGAATGEALAAVAAAASLLAAVPAAVLAVRVGLDAALFRRIADSGDLGRFDAAMAAAGLMPDGKSGRPLPDRIAGARRLVTLQGAAVAAQALFLAAAVLGAFA